MFYDRLPECCSTHQWIWPTRKSGTKGSVIHLQLHSASVSHFRAGRIQLLMTRVTLYGTKIGIRSLARATDTTELIVAGILYLIFRPDNSVNLSYSSNLLRSDAGHWYSSYLSSSRHLIGKQECAFCRYEYDIQHSFEEMGVPESARKSARYLSS